nr:hypothetical protein [Desulfobulbaceae bacterium]
MKLSTQILTASLLPFIFITSSYYYLTGHTFREHINNLYLSRTETELIQIEKNFRSFISDMEAHLKFFAAIQPPDESQASRTRISFTHLLQGSESIFQVSAINTNGREWLRVEQFPSETGNKLLNLFTSPIYLQPMLNLSFYIDKISFSTNFPIPFIDISLPIKVLRTGELSGVLWAKVSFQVVQGFLEQFIPDQGKILLLDGASGNTLVKADATEKEFLSVEQLMIKDIINNKELIGVSKSTQTGFEATFVFRKFTIKDLNFVLVYYQPDDQIYYLANRLDFNTKIFLLAGLFLFYISSFLLIKKIIRPLTKVTESLSRLKEQYKSDTAVSLGSKSAHANEVEQLQLSFSSFREQLQSYREQIEAFNHTLENKVKQRTQELQDTQDMLLHAEKLSAIGKLSASIAHEINNPLYGIQSIIEGLKLNRHLEKEDVELADLALSECNRVKNLIRDLQSFNRPSPGMKAPTEINGLINDILLITKKSLKEGNVVVRKDFATAIPRISIIPDQMKQVFLNVLNNAADSFDKKGGLITISTELLKASISIRFKDTGSGISPEHIKHIFEPFFTTKSEVKGTGLGLSVSYGIIKNHAGTITVDSELGAGSTFTINLPID